MTRTHSGSAKIYQFPTRARIAVARRSDSKPIVETRNAPGSDLAFGGGWYHEAAIREGDQSRKP